MMKKLSKNHFLEWIEQRITAVWSIVFTLLFLYIFIINFKTTLLGAPSGNSLVLLFWDTVTGGSLWQTQQGLLGSPLSIFFYISFFIIFIHLFQGIHNIFQDYVHHEKTRRWAELSIKLIQIESLKFLYIFLFF